MLALGEAAHGARDVFLARAELTQKLITAGWARALVLEDDASAVCRLDRYVRGQADDLRAALRELYGLHGHDDSEQFFRWLRAHNQSRPAAAPSRSRRSASPPRASSRRPPRASS